MLINKSQAQVLLLLFKIHDALNLKCYCKIIGFVNKLPEV